MRDRQHSCCFTGHRQLPRGKTEQIRQKLTGTIEELIRQGVVNFGCGGAVGFDMLAGETVLTLRQKYPHIKLIMVLPCRDQDKHWDEEQKRRYHELLSRSNAVRCLSETYAPGCMRIRNQYLVNHADYCVAYLERLAGGTFYTVALARQAGLKIINLAVNEAVSEIVG
jgi:uncharacterized phage-like protein YoqJ